MKILFLGGGSSIHTIRWINALSDERVDVVLATQHEALEPIAPAVKVYNLPHTGNPGYFRNVRAVKQILAKERPDLVNAHYASGYGTTARLARFAPTLVSVWGSDVYDFPTKSSFHHWWVRRNLKAATRVASTSHAMARQTRLIAPDLGEIAITPFGVDTLRFAPGRDRETSANDPIVVGTVKALKEKYGIDTLVDSIAILAEQLWQQEPDIAERIRVRIVGEGPQKEELRERASRLGIDGIIQFVGRVPHAEVPDELRKIDIYAALSRFDSESFGVAIVEAGACGLPVVVSDVGGLPEVVADGETGIVVSRENPLAAAEALRKLVLDADLRRRMGRAGRERVVSLYEWKDNVRQMIELYESVVADHRSGAQP